MARLEGEAGLFAGQSRYGKTTALIEHLQHHAPGGGRRIVVWSPKEKIDNYEGKLDAGHRTTTHRGLIATLKRVGTDDGVIVHVPRSMSEFGFWARCAYWWAKLGHGKGLQTCIVGEEIADVTSPAKAPEGWGALIRQGLGYGANVYGVSQRPAESDKTLLGNATFVHCHYLRRSGDRKYMAEEMDTTQEALRRLSKYEWLEAWAGEPDLRRGQTGG